MKAALAAVALFSCATAGEKTANPAAASRAAVATSSASGAPAGVAAEDGGTAVTAIAGSAPLPGEEVLEQQPALSPLGDFKAPAPALTTLPNGLRVYLVSQPGAALETVALVVKRGATSDPEGRAGLASLAAVMLEAGAGGKSQAEIAAAADALGASLRASAATDATSIAVSGLPLHTDEMVALLAEVALHPNLDAAEFRKAQTQRVAELQAQQAEPRVAAGLAFASALYGDSPLGRPALGTPASVQAITLADVKGFIAGYAPAESALVAVGGASPQVLQAALDKEFAGWGGTNVKKRATGKRAGEKPGVKAMHEPAIAQPPSLLDAGRLRALPASERPRLVFVDFKGRPQTVLRVGLPAVPRSSPEVMALRLLNSVLGGSFTSRLNQNLRELHGYTYGAASNFAFGRGPGPFAAQSSVKTKETGPALSEMLKEIARAAAEPLSDAELQKGKALLAYGLVEQLEHADRTAAALAEMFVDDLPIDEIATFVPRLRALTAADVLAAARARLKPDELTIVLAGDEAVVLPQLAAAGLQLPAPEQRDALGQKIEGAAK